MSKLTPKQERFALEFVKSGNAAEAYRRAYDCAGSKPETIWSEASRVLADPLVAARVAELRAESVTDAKITVQGVADKLAELRDKAIAEGQLGPAVRAEELRGKTIGAFVDRTKYGADDPMPDDQTVDRAIEALCELVGRPESLGRIRALLGRPTH